MLNGCIAGNTLCAQTASYSSAPYSSFSTSSSPFNSLTHRISLVLFAEETHWLLRLTNICLPFQACHTRAQSRAFNQHYTMDRNDNPPLPVS